MRNNSEDQIPNVRAPNCKVNRKAQCAVAKRIGATVVEQIAGLPMYTAKRTHLGT